MNQAGDGTLTLSPREALKLRRLLDGGGPSGAGSEPADGSSADVSIDAEEAKLIGKEMLTEYFEEEFPNLFAKWQAEEEKLAQANDRNKGRQPKDRSESAGRQEERHRRFVRI